MEEESFSIHARDSYLMEDSRCLFPGQQLSWSPHNVFTVCTRWTVQLSVSSMRGEASVLPKSHPMLYRPNTSFTLPWNMVCGCKWANAVVSDHYPLTCWLCVQTPCGLVAYRVIRTGGACLTPSAGVGLALDGSDLDQFKENTKVATKGKQKALRRDTSASPTTSVLGYQWVAEDRLVVLTEKGLHLAQLGGVFTDDTECQVLDISAVSYAFEKGSETPLCGLERVDSRRRFQCSTVVVMCPSELLLFEVENRSIRLLCRIEVPQFCGIYSAACFFQKGTGDDDTCGEVTGYIAGSGEVYVGSFTVDKSRHRSDSSCWTLNHWFGSNSFRGDPFISSFQSFPLHYIKDSIVYNTRLTFGLSAHSLYGFTHEGNACVELVHCFSDLGQRRIPKSALVELYTFTLHPTCLVSALAFGEYSRTVRRNAMMVAPLHVLNRKGPLYKLLELNDVVSSFEDDDSILRTLFSNTISDCFHWEPSFFAHSSIHSLRTHFRIESVFRQEKVSLEGFIHAYWTHYLELRRAHKIDLFLRWAPFTREWQLRSSSQSPNRPPEALLWWETLRLLVRHGDRAALQELVMANSVLVISKKHRYRNCSVTNGESFQAVGDGPADMTALLNYEGAVSFLREYVKERRSGSGIAPLEESYMPEWLRVLEVFMMDTKCAEHAVPYTFPCSVCDVPNSVPFDSSFQVTVTHRGVDDTDEEHTTIFSGKTFAPLAVYSQQSAVTQCAACHLSDFATGALCRVCGGMLL
ncbi:hypothetical protein ADEAN_000056500 [Angomonas deanei]|uniref:Uncharacterized protein n=1 Tax=Angomonas deanei TaxID=59799 RepID=A0A7G2C043_9TRYP|nr:hypothetical protein ADEAN_000056500 [Angomonas deanei]